MDTWILRLPWTGAGPLARYKLVPHHDGGSLLWDLFGGYDSGWREPLQCHIRIMWGALAIESEAGEHVRLTRGEDWLNWETDSRTRWRVAAGERVRLLLTVERNLLERIAAMVAGWAEAEASGDAPAAAAAVTGRDHEVKT